MIKKISFGLFVVLTALFFVNCSSIKTDESKAIEKKRIVLFSENDSQILADSVVNKILSQKWESQFTLKRKPRIIVGTITNRTNENINVELLSKNIERSFINSGKISFISSKVEREKIRYNRKNKTDFNGEAELKKYLSPLNSDFFISGSFSLQIDSTVSPIQKKYKLSLDVVQSETAKVISSQFASLVKR